MYPSLPSAASAPVSRFRVERPMRSLLFTPGQREQMVRKALKLPMDAVILDLEDGVPADEKDRARTLVAAAVAEAREDRDPARLVRVNAAATGRLEDDLAAVVLPGLDGILVPKVDSATDLDQIAAIIADLEAKAGLPPGGIPLLAAIESARGVAAAADIAVAGPRVIALVLGAEDLALDLGLPVVRTGVAHELLAIRSSLVVAAALGRIAAIDQVWTDFHDVSGLETDARQARQLGFRGKCLIHPSQIEIVNAVFSPSAEEIDQARRVVAAFEAAETSGLGAVMLGGQLVERPIVDRAKGTLRVADMLASRNSGLPAS